MNIEQAREVSNQLANYDNDGVTPQICVDGSDTIDALIAELALITSTLESRDRNNETLAAQNRRLQAELATLKSQEPVAWGIVASNTGRICQVELDAAEVEDHKQQYIRPLFLAAGAQPVQQEPDVWTWDTAGTGAMSGTLEAHFQFRKPEESALILNLRPLYAQPVQQEPVAWAIFTDSGNARMWSTFQPHVQKLANAEGLTVTPLYSAPVQAQERKPLSDRQISLLWSHAHNDTTDRMAFQVFARAIEAAHGIKGVENES